MIVHACKPAGSYLMQNLLQDYSHPAIQLVAAAEQLVAAAEHLVAAGAAVVVVVVVVVASPVTKKLIRITLHSSVIIYLRSTPLDGGRSWTHGPINIIINLYLTFTMTKGIMAKHQWCDAASGCPSLVHKSKLLLLKLQICAYHKNSFSVLCSSVELLFLAN